MQRLDYKLFILVKSFHIEIIDKNLFCHSNPLFYRFKNKDYTYYKLHCFCYISIKSIKLFH